MYPHDIVFKLNETESLVVDLEIPFKLLPCYCQTIISFYDGQLEYILNINDDLQSSMEKLHNNLIKGINNQLCLHKSITEDIGFLYNECLKYESKSYHDDNWQENPDLVYVYEGDYSYWIGKQYQIWGSSKWITWLYNDVNRNIIFEITPQYQGFFVEEGEMVVVLSYEEWSRLYQSAIRRIIPKNIAHMWLEQATKIINDIKEQFARVAESADNQKLVYEKCPRRKFDP